MTQYGLLSYDTFNIGDEIQSLAAMRFLPNIDTLFDRDNINKTKLNTDTKLIINGWYTHSPENWPPNSNNLHPLLISMYIEQFLDDKITQSFTSKESLSFLKKWGPVGARDLTTLDFLQANNIDAYFSGCLTLTLKKEPSIKRQDFILAIGVPPKVIKHIKANTNREIIQFDTLHNKIFSQSEKVAIARYYLFMYQSAHMVITTRLHCMLPCLALETPVIALEGKEPYRYKGLMELTNHYSVNNFTKQKIDFERPRQNPKTYLKYRKNLIKTVSSFTGTNSDHSFLDNMNQKDFLTSTPLVSAISKAFSDSGSTAIDNASLLNRINITAQEYEESILELKVKNTQLKEENLHLKNQLTISQNPTIRDSLANIKNKVIKKIKNNKS